MGLLSLSLGTTVWPYAALIFIGIVGGQLAGFAMGAVASTGRLSALAVYVVFVLGDVLTDSCYYFIGRSQKVQSFAMRSGKKLGLSAEHFTVLQEEWQQHTFGFMLVSKYGLALAAPLLVSAGVAKLPIRTFYLYAVSISVVQYAFFVALGYYFAEAFNTVSLTLKAVQITLAIAIFWYVFQTARRVVRDRLAKVEARKP